MDEQILQLGYALMAELAAQDEPQAALSSARLCKRLGVRMSSLQRCLAYFGGDGSAAGLGWINVMPQEDRVLLSLSAAGYAQWQAWQQEQDQENRQSTQNLADDKK